MCKTARIEDVKHVPGQIVPVAAATTVLSGGFWIGLVAFCVLLLSGWTAAAQTTYTVTRFDDTNSVDTTTTDFNYNLPGLGAGVAGDLRYGLQQAIAAGGTWTINFPSTCTTANPCTIVLSNPLPPIESGADVVIESGYGYEIGSNPVHAGKAITVAPPALNLTIDGGQFGQVILDGAGAYRVFFIDSGVMTLANLQIQNAKAKGGNGGTGGGGGGLGAGAGLFVNKAGAQVYVQNTYFLNNQVAGGAGGADNGLGGGGGMGFSGASGGSSNCPYGGGMLSAGQVNGGGAGGGGWLHIGIDEFTKACDSTGKTVAYGSNAAAPDDSTLNVGGSGGFGGGGSNANHGGFGGGGGSNVSTTAIGNGSGGFGGGGGGAAVNGGVAGTVLLGGFGGGNGGMCPPSDPGACSSGGGGGGAAFGSAIFVNQGTLTTYNSGAVNDDSHLAAASGAAGACLPCANGGTSPTVGTADLTPVFNAYGTVNGATVTSPQHFGTALPAGMPATHFSIAVTPSPLPANGKGAITVAALDPEGNTTLAYNGAGGVSATNADNGPISVTPNSLSFVNGTASSGNLVLMTVGIDNTVTATDSLSPYITGISGDITSGATLSSILVASAGSDFFQGQSEQFFATSNYSNGLSQDSTAQVTWTSLNPSVASIASGGVATGVSSGMTLISASLNGVTSNHVLTIVGATAPASLNVLSGSGQTAYVGTAFTAPLTVQVLDTIGLPLAGLPVTFTGPSSGASVLFSNNLATITATTDGTGMVTVAAPVPNLIAGSYNVTATVGSATASLSFVNQAMPLYTVTTLTDDNGSGVCTDHMVSATLDAACNLRDAIAAASSIPQSTLATPTMPAINFSTTALGISSNNPGTYSVVPNGTLTIAGNMNIAGPGANLLSIDGGSTKGVFGMFDGFTASISGLTISNGHAGAGGGINNGLFSGGGNLTVSSCSFLNNTGVYGGAISSYGPLAVSNTTFTENTAISNGGGISSSGGATTISNSTFSGNTAGSQGGGIFDNSVAAEIAVNNTTFSNNSATVYGGGIYANATATIENSTFSANSAGSGGGGIRNAGILTVTNSIFANNASTSAATNAGIGNQNIAFLDSNVFFHNLAVGVEEDCTNCTTNTNAVTGDPMLAALGNYGGVNQTMLPQPGSAAICAGAAANIPTGLTTDQRGFARTNAAYPGYSSGNLCVDAGAVQTSYVMTFSQLPPASVPVIQTVSPSPAIAVTESAVPATAVSSNITLTDSASLLTGVTSQNLSGGAAVFAGLSFSADTGSDKLTATMALNPSLNLTAQSNTFQVTGYDLAALTAPAPGSTLTGTSATFTWTTGYGPVAYQLRVGTTGVGSYDLLNSGSLTVTSASLSNLPANGATLYVRLFSKINGVWQSNDYTCTESGVVVPAVLTTPTPGTSLTGSSATFTWTAGSGPVAYQLRVGTTGVGSYDLLSSGSLTGTTASLSNLPTNGATLYVRLYFKISGVWQFTDYTYTESGALASPVLTAPTPGTTLTGSSATFTWTSGSGPVAYQFRVGTTGAGSYNLFNSGLLTVTTASLSNLPTDGATLYVRLYFKTDGAWQFTDYTYTESGTLAPPVLTGPTPGATLTGSSATFTWTAGSGPVAYQFRVGTTGVGSYDLFNSGVTTATSASLSNLPTNGATLYVRLYFKTDGAWQFTDYTYTESGTLALPVLITPTPGTTLTGSSVTFTWTAGSGPVAYQFRVGTTKTGSYDLYNSPSIHETSVTLSNLPGNGATIYVRLCFKINGVWQFTDYTYTGSPI